MKKLILFWIAIAAVAQTLPDHYIVELSGDSIAKSVAREGRKLQRSDARAEGQRSRIQGEQRSLRNDIERQGDSVIDQFEIVANALVVRMPASRAAEVRQLPGVKAVRPVRIYKRTLDHALPLHNVTAAWQQIGGMEKAGLGKKIAILDSGIDPNHPAFAGSTLKAPEGFPLVSRDSEREFTNGKVIVARSYSSPGGGQRSPVVDIDGHGTAVAMVAAGATASGPLGPITGVAPAAWLGNYSVFHGESAFDSVIIRALEDAISDGMDVINLSLGSFAVDRPSQDQLVQAVEAAISAGKVVVIAAGNDGTELNTIHSPGTSPSAITVGSTENDRVFASSVQSAEHPPYRAFPGDGPNSPEPISGTLVDVANVDPTGLACGALPADSLKGSIALILRGVCFFADKLTNVQAAGAVGAVIYTDEARPDPFAFGATPALLPAVMVSYSDGIDLKSRLAADSTLSVTVDFIRRPLSSNPLRLSSFSGKGPSADLGIKPDLVTVGSDVYSAAPLNLGGYTVTGGTSFSSPTVAGAAALLMAARPGLTASQYKSLLVNSSGTFSVDGASPLSVQLGGAGYLNVTSSLAGTVTANPVSLGFGSTSGTVDQTTRITLTNVSPNADTFSITAQPIGEGITPTIDANSVQLEPGQSRELQVRFAASALSPGTYQGFLAVQGGQSPVVARVPYWFAVPSQTPRFLQIIQPTEAANAGVNSTQTIFFRFLDAAGLPVTEGVTTDLATGAPAIEVGSVDAQVFGAFYIDVKMPATRGTVTVRIELLGVGKDVTFNVN